MKSQLIALALSMLTKFFLCSRIASTNWSRILAVWTRGLIVMLTAAPVSDAALLSQQAPRGHTPSHGSVCFVPGWPHFAAMNPISTDSKAQELAPSVRSVFAPYSPAAEASRQAAARTARTIAVFRICCQQSHCGGSMLAHPRSAS